MRNLKVAIIAKKDASNPKHQDIHLESIRLVQEAFREENISFTYSTRHSLNKIQNADLVVTIGGDGTFLHASHLLSPKQILMGVNSVPQASHGEYCLCDAKKFKAVLKKYLLGKLRVTEASLLEAEISGNKLSLPALNDILFCHPSPAGTTRYEIKVRGKTEEQKSSGIWISTATGSTAAIHSAGGKILKPADRRFQYVVREPFYTKKNPLRLTRGLLKKTETLKLTPHMPEARIFVDGCHHSFVIKNGESLSVRLSPNKVRLILKRR